MKVGELREFLNDNDIPDDREISVALFIGPGSPSATVYGATGARKFSLSRDSQYIWITADVYDLVKVRS